MSSTDASSVKIGNVWKIVGSLFQNMGSGKNRTGQYNCFNEKGAQKKGIIPINNKDNLRPPRAEVVATMIAEKSPDYAKT
ncbi:hypothetical protein JTB14_027914 [Gonioctena quinquepunctata]|nr:hypothetical protein JTB14_027914 [Gonioctena quinquepunctata]